MDERPKSVLLIESSPDDARLTEGALEEGGRGAFRLLWASSLRDGFGRLAEGGVDLVLLALDLPDSEGPSTFDNVCRRFPDVPIVLLAAESDEDQALELLKRGAQEYLVKNQTDGRLMVRCLRHAMERHRLVREIQALSLVDDLTGLHNRRGFIALAQQQQRVSERKREPFHVLYVDLDNMKWINDHFGHHYGDQALVDLSDVLESTFRESDVVARMGGDEFVVLVTDADEDDISALRARLDENLRARSAEKSRPYELRVCAGVARYDPGSSESIDEIVEEADKLMYGRKRCRRAS